MKKNPGSSQLALFDTPNEASEVTIKELEGGLIPMPAGPWAGWIASMAATRTAQQMQCCAWVVPRVEHMAPLRQALAEYWTGQGFEVVNSPCIISVDRLSDHRDEALQLRLLSDVDEVLAQYPQLVGALGMRQRWALAQEYLELATQYVLASPNSEQALATYQSSAHAAGPEAAVITAVANLYHDELKRLLPGPPPHPGWAQALEVIWVWDGEPLAHWWVHQQADDKAVTCLDVQTPVDPMSNWVGLTRHTRLLRTPDAESQAHGAAMIILQWLADPRIHNIAIAVVDRVLARRVRAKLESCGVLMDDRTGWRLSTTRAAGWLLLWIRFAQQRSGSLWLSLLDDQWLPEWRWLSDSATRQSLLRKWSESAWGDAWPAIASHAQRIGVSGWLAYQAAIEQWTGGEHPSDASRGLSDWASALLLLLQDLGSAQALQADRAGLGCIEVLRMLARAGSDRAMTAGQFAVVFEHACEQGRFRAQDVSSPVRMMPLLSLHLQRFDAVLVLGCADRHFIPSPPGLLPPAVAAELGLPGPTLARQQKLAALIDIMSHHELCVLTAAHTEDGQQQAVLGVLERMGLHWAQHPRDRAQPWLVPWEVSELALTGTPAAALSNLHLTPAAFKGGLRYSVGAVGDLAACTLRFALLRASWWQDEPAIETGPDARDRGDLIHAVIEQFHRQTHYTDLINKPYSVLLAAMDKALEQVWSGYPAEQRPALFAMRWEWVNTAAQTLTQLVARAKAGWAVLAQELPAERRLRWGACDTEAVLIHGRIDRLEQRSTGVSERPYEQTVVDIKTNSQNSVKRQANDPLRWPQLPAYQWLLGQEGKPSEAELMFLNVDKKRVQWIPVVKPEEALTWGDQWAQRTSGQIQALAHGDPAVPQPGEACTYCAVAGSCRAGWWANAASLYTQDGEGSGDA